MARLLLQRSIVSLALRSGSQHGESWASQEALFPYPKFPMERTVATFLIEDITFRLLAELFAPDWTIYRIEITTPTRGTVSIYRVDIEPMIRGLTRLLDRIEDDEAKEIQNPEAVPATV